MNPETGKSTSKVDVDLDDFFEQIGLDIAQQVRAQLEQEGPVDPKKFSGAFVAVAVASTAFRKAVVQIYAYSDPIITYPSDWLRSKVSKEKICILLPGADPLKVQQMLNNLGRPTHKALLMIYEKWEDILKTSGADAAYQFVKDNYDLDDTEMDVIKDYICACREHI